MTKAEQARLGGWRLKVLQQGGRRLAGRRQDVPAFRHLPQDVLQVEAAVRRARSGRRRRPLSPTTLVATGDVG